jgi:hypothetical protein
LCRVARDARTVPGQWRTVLLYIHGTRTQAEKVGKATKGNSYENAQILS